VFLQGGTYGGSVLGCAAAAATLDVIKEENLLQNATQRGQQMTEGLLKLSQVGGVVL
jgi:4-aminobutyrate aminotransferase